MSGSATTKLVIVEGQTFVVDATIGNETIREHRIRQGCANLAGAKIRTGTRQHQGQTVPTVDGIKRAGTKGKLSAVPHHIRTEGPGIASRSFVLEEPGDDDPTAELPVPRPD